MRTFTSYGPINTHLHYYAPRTALIDSIYHHLIGTDTHEDGHYITVWAPRQTGKTWIMNEVLLRLRREQASFDAAKLNIQDLEQENTTGVFCTLATRLGRELQRELPTPGSQQEFAEIFSRAVLDKPLILMLDEFDTLPEDAIRGVVSVLRNISMYRRQEADRPTDQKTYLLHGVALIGVRSILGIDSHSGSPFNIQRSVPIPNLTPAEVTGMFTWYSQESGQQIDADVMQGIYNEMQGQPGLTGWFGELLTDTYQYGGPTITMTDFTAVLQMALNTPNNTILNILSKAQHEAARPLVLRLFEPDTKKPFRYDDPQTNLLYMHGVVDQESSPSATRYLKFSSPFVQLFCLRTVWCTRSSV